MPLSDEETSSHLLDTEYSNIVTFSMSGNCDLPGWEVNQDIVQVRAGSYSAVPTTSHVTHIALESIEAVTLCTCTSEVTTSEHGNFNIYVICC